MASITDSKNGNYQADQNNAVTMDTTIDLSDASIAFVEFWAKWEIETNWDYVQFFIQQEGQSNWTALAGPHTKKGNNEYLSNDEPYYDGFVDWVHEKIEISEFAGEKVKFKFVLVTDGYEQEDGFYFDDFIVSVISTATSVNENNMQKITVSNAYPNPTTGLFTVTYNVNSSIGNGELQIS